MNAPTRFRAADFARTVWRVSVSASLLAALTACSTWTATDKVLGLITPYKVEVVQGNVITKEQAALVKPGQSRAQVRDILGSPLLMDVFHADRWDYMFTIRRQGAEPQQRQVVVRFEGDTLKSIEAPELPAERDFVASIDTFKTSRNAPPLALTDAQIQALPMPSKAPATATATATDATTPPAPTRTYPPLEGK